MIKPIHTIPALLAAAALLQGCANPTYLPWSGDSSTRYEDADFRRFSPDDAIARYEAALNAQGYQTTRIPGNALLAKIDYTVLDGVTIEEPPVDYIDSDGNPAVNINSTFQPNGKEINITLTARIDFEISPSQQVHAITRELSTSPGGHLRSPIELTARNNNTPVQRFDAIFKPITFELAKNP